jgi:hypothetical protein
MRYTRFTGTGNSLPIIGIGLLLTAFGILCGSFIWPEWQRANDLRRGPQTVRLSDLIERGCGENPHVLVTDFVWDECCVWVVPEKGAEWSKVWIPLWLPEDRLGEGNAQRPAGHVVKAIFVSHKLKQVNDVARLTRTQVVEGLVSVRAWGDEGLDSLSKSELERHYPDTDFDNCVIVEDKITGESSVAEPLAAAVVIGGAGLALITVGIIVLLISQYKKARLVWAKSQLNASPERRRARRSDDEAIRPE